MSSRVRILIAVALSVLVAAPGAAVAVVDASAPTSPAASTASTGPPAIPQRYLDQEIRWSRCGFDDQVKEIHPKAPTTRCATVKAPMDWNAPDDHRDISLRIAYSEATGKSQGLLMSNPGGPGGAGLSLSASLAADKPRMFQRFDLLGFDPRGFGQSEALRCRTTAEEVEALPVTPDHRERSGRTHRAEVAEARLLADACSKTDFAEFVSSQQTVYDMDFLRALMDARQTHFIGYSYGTWLGSWYADTYPERVGRFVLDSNMDWTHTQWENTNFDPFSFQRRRDTQLLPWIARHADQIDGLGGTSERVLDRYEEIRADVADRLESGHGTVRPDDLDGSVASAIYGNTRFIRATLDILIHDEYAETSAKAVTAPQIERAWRRLAPALRTYDSLAEAKERYGVGEGGRATSLDVLAEARDAAASSAGDEVVDLGAIGTTVRCNDTAWNDDPGFYRRESDRMTRKYPFFGYLNGVSMCAFWPHQAQDRDVDLSGSPRLLMITGEVDPATSYEGALRSHRDTRAATRLVSIDDEGQHGQYVGSYSDCAERIGDRFLFGGEAPGRNRVCGTSPLPGDGAVYPVDGPVDGNSVPLPRSQRPYRPDTPNPLLRRVLDRVATTSLTR